MNLIIVQSFFLLISYIFGVPSCIAWSPLILSFLNSIINGVDKMLKNLNDKSEHLMKEVEKIKSMSQDDLEKEIDKIVEEYEKIKKKK